MKIPCERTFIENIDRNICNYLQQYLNFFATSLKIWNTVIIV